MTRLKDIVEKKAIVSFLCSYVTNIIFDGIKGEGSHKLLSEAYVSWHTPEKSYSSGKKYYNLASST